MVVGIGLLMLGTLLTLIPSLAAIVAGLLLNAFGFFLAHAQAAGWVSRHATRARASVSSLYLVFYYAGASIGGFYLGPFWNWLGWPAVVVAAVLGFLVALLLALWLRSDEIAESNPDAAMAEPATSPG
jgi:YNFM family putative membrane transporter